MKRYAFIILAALTLFGVASTANAQVFSSSRSHVSGGRHGFQSDHQSVYVNGGGYRAGSVYRGGTSVYVGGGRGGFDIGVNTPGFSFHIGDGYGYGYGRHRGPVYRPYPPQRYYPPVYRQPRYDYPYGYGYQNQAPTAVVYDRYGYPVRVRLYQDGYGCWYYYLDGYRYNY